MRLGPAGSSLKAWFGGDNEAASQFAGFGSGPDGSLLAFWLYKGPNVAEAPVIHLGSEGQNNVLLASNFREFLRLFGIGYGELGFDDLAALPSEPETAERLRGWLLSEYGIVPPATGADIVRKAQAHPSLEVWVKEWQAQRSR